MKTIHATNKKIKTPLKWVPLTVTYHLNLPPLKSILNKHSSILAVSERLSQAVNPLVAYHCRPNLRNLLVWATSKLWQPSYKGNSQRHQTWCKTCHHIKMVDTFNSSTTGRTYTVKATAIKTQNVVYVMEGKHCKKQYMGETKNALHVQINGHQSIKHQQLEKPVAKHFYSNGHSLEIFLFSY